MHFCIILLYDFFTCCNAFLRTGILCFCLYLIMASNNRQYTVSVCSLMAIVNSGLDCVLRHKKIYYKLGKDVDEEAFNQGPGNF